MARDAALVASNVGNARPAAGYRAPLNTVEFDGRPLFAFSHHVKMVAAVLGDVVLEDHVSVTHNRICRRRHAAAALDRVVANKTTPHDRYLRPTPRVKGAAKYRVVLGEDAIDELEFGVDDIDRAPATGRDETAHQGQAAQTNAGARQQRNQATGAPTRQPGDGRASAHDRYGATERPIAYG